jgi:hypothetical protein
MKRRIAVAALAAGMLLAGPAYAEMKAKEAYDYMTKTLSGEWTMSPASKQIGTTGAHKHPAVKRLLGTDKTGTAYKVIGRGATLMEHLLPGTMKEMVTMYYCDNYHDCQQLEATHYCAKQNHPAFIFNEKESKPGHLVFDCDEENSEVCDSDGPHIHQIILDLSENNNHLRASYLGYRDGEPDTKHSIYHFDRRK